MLQLYTVPDCDGSRQAKKWLKHYGIAYEEHNLLLQGHKIRPLLYQFLPLLEEEVTDLLAIESKAYHKFEKRLKNISLSEWVDYLVCHPEMISHPIIWDGIKLQLGFHPEEIHRFVPQPMRKVSCQMVIERMNKQK